MHGQAKAEERTQEQYQLSSQQAVPADQGPREAERQSGVGFQFNMMKREQGNSIMLRGAEDACEPHGSKWGREDERCEEETASDWGLGVFSRDDGYSALMRSNVEELAGCENEIFDYPSCGRIRRR